MNYRFKLSRRLARVRAATVVAAATLFNLACTADQTTGPDSPPADNSTSISVTPGAVSLAARQTMQFHASVDSSSEAYVQGVSKILKGRGRGRRTVVDLAITPHTVTAREGSTTSFLATATLSDSTTTELSVTWAATGGTIDPGGKFTAGQIPGNYTVSATTPNGVADTAVVVISENAPSIGDVELSPTSASLLVGGSKRFTAIGKSTEGTIVAVSAKYAATGGIISVDGVYQAGQIPGKYHVIATDTTVGLADTSAVTIEAPLSAPPPPALEAVVVSPANVSLVAGVSQAFTASGKMSDGSDSVVEVVWSATGGTISPAGLYNSGPTAGTYRVVATQSGGSLADTAIVTITSEVVSVTVSPASASVVAGKTTQLAATANKTDGSPVSGASMSWGSSNLAIATVSPTGLVTGVAPGSVVITATSSDVRGQASITVTPAPIASADGCPDGGYLRLVDVSTANQLSGAVASALPGDQIRLAPGNYNYSQGLNVHGRSGTAANRIVMCGPKTAIVNAYVWMQASYWTLTGFRIRGDTPLGKVWGVYQDMGGNNIYDNLEVDHQNQEGIVIHDGPSYNNVVQYNYIHDNGLARADRGECIYIGNGDDPTQVVDKTWIHHNKLVNCRSEGVEIKSGSAGNTIEFNTITNAGHGGVVGSDAPIQIRGNDNQVRDNIIDRSPRYGIELWVANAPNDGNNNIFRRNTISGAGNGKAFYIQSGHAGNVVYCDNVAVDPGVLGVSCTR